MYLEYGTALPYNGGPLIWVGNPPIWPFVLIANLHGVGRDFPPAGDASSHHIFLVLDCDLHQQ
jgi:hypothetical protein